MKKPPPQPTFILLAESDGARAVQVAIVQGKDSCHYLVGALPHQYGEAALRFQKKDASSGTDKEESRYDVLLDAGDFDSCSCKGFQRHNHCKHVECANWLLDQVQDLPPWKDWPADMTTGEEGLIDEGGLYEDSNIGPGFGECPSCVAQNGLCRACEVALAAQADYYEEEANRGGSG